MLVYLSEEIEEVLKRYETLKDTKRDLMGTADKVCM